MGEIMTVYDMYALEKWLEDKALDSACAEEWNKVAVYREVLNKIYSMRTYQEYPYQKPEHQINWIW